MPKISNNRIVFDQDDWLSGLNQQYGTPTGFSLYNKKIGNSFASTQAVTPFRYLGYLAPSCNPVTMDVLGQTTAYLRKSLTRSFSGTSFQIGITNGTQILKFSGTATVASTNFPKTIAAHGGHSAVVGDDIVNYQANIGGTSALRTFYSWNDNTDWDVGVISDLTATFDDDFMTTVPATPLADNWGGVAANDYLTLGQGKPHPMLVGEDDVLYIGSGRYVHAYDGSVGANGTFSGAVFTLPPDYVITAFARITGYLVIFAHNSDDIVNLGRADAKAFFWDYLEDDATYIEELNDNYVSEAFEYNGTVGCFTSGRVSDVSINRKSKLKIYTGGEFATVAEFNSVLPIRGGVYISDEEILWNAAGMLFSYNSQYAPKSLHIIAKGTGTTSGLFNINLGNYTMSSGTTTSGGLELLSGSDTFDENANFTTIMSSPYNTKRTFKIKRIVVYFADTCSGGLGFSATIQTSRGRKITDIKTSLAPITAVTEADMVREFYFTADGSAFPEFESIGIVGAWNAGATNNDAPILDRIEIEVEPIH